MKKYLKKVASDLWYEQTADWKTVRPVQSWDTRKRQFVLISPAGVIRFRPKTQVEMQKFRDRFINKFEAISTVDSKWVWAYFILYGEIKKDYSVSYSANLVTRLKGVLCSLGRLN